MDAKLVAYIVDLEAQAESRRQAQALLEAANERELAEKRAQVWAEVLEAARKYLPEVVREYVVPVSALNTDYTVGIELDGIVCLHIQMHGNNKTWAISASKRPISYPQMVNFYIDDDDAKEYEVYFREWKNLPLEDFDTALIRAARMRRKWNVAAERAKVKLAELKAAQQHREMERVKRDATPQPPAFDKLQAGLIEQVEQHCDNSQYEAATAKALLVIAREIASGIITTIAG